MNWDALTEVINKELRNHLGVVEKRNEELKLALEVAKRERDEAILWKAEYIRQVTEKDEQCAEAHALLFKAEADRDAAREDAKWMSKYATEAMDLMDKQGD